jgi:hypothetical protein
MNSLSTPWLAIAAVLHIVQWAVLLAIGSAVLSDFIVALLAVLMVVVVVLLCVTRWMVKKKRAKERITHLGDGQLRVELHPEDEFDRIPDVAVRMLMVATALEGFMFAIFTAMAAGAANDALAQSGYRSQGSILEVLRFASITLLAFHRTIRPANRIDPMRTILEVSACPVQD